MIVQKNTSLYKKGLSIIETVVAVLILSFVIGAPVAVLQQGLRLSQDAEHRIAVRFLAEEPLEYIRNIKDSNIVESVNNVKIGNPPISFSEGLLMACEEGTGDNCLIDVHQDIFDECPGSGPCPIRYTDSPECGTSTLAGCERIYGHETVLGGSTYDSDSGYWRKVTVESISADEFRVRIVAGWGPTPFVGTKQVASEDYYRSFGFD